MQLGDAFGIVEQVTEVLQFSPLSVKDKAGLSASKCCTLGDNSRLLLEVHQKLLYGQNKSKVPKDSSSSEFYKVVICPEIFFSDDTAGGNLKKFSPYESSWSMVHAALPYEDRARRENTKYPECVPKSEVEVLHCIPLGVGQYLIEHLAKVALGGKTNKARMNRFVQRLKENQGNQAYTRTFRKQLQHVGSFLGRDFKQLMQILPHIIADEFTNPCVDKDLLLLNETLIVLGKLCSLVFVRKVESDFEAYVKCIKTTVEDLSEKILVFDRDTNNPHPFLTRPKAHYLHHQYEDIRRFGCALHFETEKGEMFNKFIKGSCSIS